MRILVLLGITLVLAHSSSGLQTWEGRLDRRSGGTLYARLERGWSDRHSVSEQDLINMRKEVKTAFDYAYENYIKHAFPMDNLLPISCKGSNSEGGMAITLLDSLDTLIVLNKSSEFRRALEQIEEHVRFDLDHLVHVFEVNIRALGGLLSAHVLIEQNQELVPDYNGSLLQAASDLANRLLPAFDTESGIPRSKINLKTGGLTDAIGRLVNDHDETCSACAGTLLLEMGMLSRLTGQSVFEEKAKKAVLALYNLRSRLGLLGNTVHVQHSRWTRADSSIGAGIDSIYEYLLKAYFLFGDSEYLTMFTELYSSVMQHMKTPKLAGGYQWLADVNIDDGFVMHAWIWSVAAFWPGMQALAGQMSDAKDLHENFTTVWMKFAALPEQFSLDGTKSHPEQRGYPLRPELFESTFLLHSMTKDPYYLELGRIFQKCLLATKTSACGFGSIRDVATGELSDAMESFFLSESLKYLYLLHSNVTSFVNAYVLTTEAHLFPPIYGEEDQQREQLPNHPFYKMPKQCEELCEIASYAEIRQHIEEITKSFPALRPSAEDFRIIQNRRCHACIYITSHLESLPQESSHQVIERMKLRWVLSEQPEQDVIIEAGPIEAYSESWNMPYDVVASVQCILQVSKTDPMPFSCLKIEPVQSSKINVNQGAEPVIFRRLFPHEWNRRGRLVLSYPHHLRELTGVLHQYTGMKFADKEISQMCPAMVLNRLQQQEGFLDFLFREKIISCEKELISGQLIKAEPLTLCGRFTNLHLVRDSIVVVSQAECITFQKFRILKDAGAVGVILLKQSPQRNEWMLDLTHYLGSLPVFILSPSDGSLLLQMLETEEEVFAMMGRSLKSLLKCYHARSRFTGLQHENQPPNFKEEIVLPKETKALFANAVHKGQVSTNVIRDFLEKLTLDERMRKMLQELERK